MKASEQRRLSALGSSDEFINHSDPTRDVASLWPALIPSDIKLERLPVPRTSWDLVEELRRRGDEVEEVPFGYYRASTYEGVNRRLDNSDWLKGKEPLYGGDLALCNQIRQEVRAVNDEMIAYYEPREDSSLIASMEMQSLPKTTAQQWRPTGCFCYSPISEVDVPAATPFMQEWFDKVALSVYGPELEGARHDGLPTDFYGLVMLDDDPPDTMTGAPTFVSGEKSHEARIAVLKALPDPTSTSPEEWVAAVEALGATLGYPSSTFWNPVLAYRSGPLKKPLPLWVRQDGGYIAYYQATGVYDRSRYVFPAPYYVNFILSPLYVEMSSVRKRKLGLWHDPEHIQEYTQKLRRQGKYAFSIDFSGMDTAMRKSIVCAAFRALKKAGFSKWPIDTFLRLYPKMGITMPHYGGQVGFASVLSGDFTPWCSGFKLTSEVDTFYGMTVLLSCLERQQPGIFQRWASGDWIFLELGDDIMFTTDFEIDADKLAEDAKTLWGATLKIIHDAMFLQTFIPVDPEIPERTRPLSRFLQQTFYNEDRYDGVEGGTRPNAIMRLALQARMALLDRHPDFQRWWPKIFPILCKLVYVRESSDRYRRELSAGRAILDEGDEQAILAYAQRQPKYFLNLRARAKYEPSAAQALRLMEDQGMTLDLDPIATAMRQTYVQALKTPPSSDAIRSLEQYVPAALGFSAV